MSDLLREILPLGDPRLRRVAARVEDVNDRGVQEEVDRLEGTLSVFRAAYGFGRAIAAPQIGIGRRFIALDLGRGPRVVINPELVWWSDETFTMWDDCMCFPDLLVRVRRHRSVSLRFLDREGQAHEWSKMDVAAAELLQHEIDHLDGVLALDRAIDREAIISRKAYSAAPEHFKAQVDYVIGS